MDGWQAGGAGRVCVYIIYRTYVHLRRLMVCQKNRALVQSASAHIIIISAYVFLIPSS